MGDTPLSIRQKAAACSVCGRTSETKAGWFFRREKQDRRNFVEINYCPSCAAKAQTEIQEQSRDANLQGGILLGALGAALGALGWYALVLFTNTKFGIAAVGVGWLVGRAVLLGAGNKKGGALEVAAAALALVGLIGGEYLIINHAARDSIEGFSGWLNANQFLTIYGQVMVKGNGLWDAFFSVLAVMAAVGQLRPLRLRPRP